MADYNLDPLELAALVASRVCHDIISPVGAIVNGLEVLEEEKDESMREFAMDLVQKSARQASAKLQFSRLAFGASGGAGAEIDMADAGRVAGALMEREKAELDWQVKAGLLPKAQAKLLMNLLIIALNSVARGGKITVSAEGAGWRDRDAGRCRRRPGEIPRRRHRGHCRGRDPQSARRTCRSAALYGPLGTRGEDGCDRQPGDQPRGFGGPPGNLKILTPS